MTIFDAIFLASLGLLLLYIYLTWNHNYWRSRGILYEKPSIIFGNLTLALLGKKSFGQIINDVYRKYPGQKVIGWFKYRQPGILIRDPDLIRRVLISDFNSFRNNDVAMDESTDPILGKNIFVLKDERWKRGRNLITPAFTAGKIKAVYPAMVEVAKELVEYLKRHPEELHVKHVMSRYTSEVFASCAVGIKGNSFTEPTPTIQEMGKLIFEPNFLKGLKMLAFFTMPKICKLLRLKLVPTKVTDFFGSILQDVIMYRQEKNIERNDLVNYLIEVKKKSIEVAEGAIKSDNITKTYTDSDILSGCIMFFIEIYETSSLVLNNVLYCLAKHKEAQKALKREINEALGEGELTFERLHAMPYLNGVYLETNRILPATFNLQKVCTEKYEMNLGKSEPLIIEKDMPVVIPVLPIHMDPAYWEEPDSFKPERFLDKEEAVVKSKGIFLPFGDGPRMCPGARLATTVIKIAVVHICKHFEIVATSRTPDEIRPDPNYFMLAHKGGIYLKFAEANSS